MHDEAVAPTERAQSDNEPTPVKLPLPISWRESLRAGWSSDGVTRSEFLLRELLLGVVVCMAQIPESIAFAYLARVRPPVALHSAWIVGLVCALGGGRPGMINGATGAFAAIIATFLEEPDVEGGNGAGIETLFPSVIVAGVLMLGVCYFRLDRFVALLPLPVMIGFCNGLAVVIGRPNPSPNPSSNPSPNSSPSPNPSRKAHQLKDLNKSQTDRVKVTLPVPLFLPLPLSLPLPLP